jgi:hypothetical protein
LRFKISVVSGPVVAKKYRAVSSTPDTVPFLFSFSSVTGLSAITVSVFVFERDRLIRDSARLCWFQKSGPEWTVQSRYSAVLTTENGLDTQVKEVFDPC